MKYGHTITVNNRKKIGVGHKKGNEVFPLLPFYLAEALKNVPQLGHLKSPTVTIFLPLGANVQVFSGLVTSVPHFGHFAICYTLSPLNYEGV
jgi:hypothetical protein